MVGIYKKNPHMYVSSLHYYPVKSCKGIEVEVAAIDARGIKNDRRLMLIDMAGNFLTQRGHPKVALIEAFLEDSWLMLKAPGMSLMKNHCRNTGKHVDVVIWNERCDAVDQGDAVASWLSLFIGVPCRLVRIPDEFVRKVDPNYAPDENAQVGFADGFPFLLMSESSLADLNARSPKKIDMLRFRPNIVFAGGPPLIEDTWKRIRIGTIEFHVVKPCARCVVTTIDQQSGVQGKEPLRTLAQYRHIPHKGVLFGQNLVHSSEGTIRVGDEVQVVALRDDQQG